MADRAILVGINNYATVRDLQGCRNDVDNLHRLLTAHHGFPEAAVRRFYDEQVTRAVIEREFAWLSDGAQPGDRLVFHFSGHGSQIRSANDDEDVDELLCLHDMDFNDPRSFLVDDDLGALARGVPDGVRLTVILDCCHSGTGTRALVLRGRGSVAKRTALAIVDRGGPASGSGAAGRRARAAASESAAPIFARYVAPPAHLRPRGGSVAVRPLGRTLASSLDHLLFAAASDQQTAADAPFGDHYEGAFTHHFCAAAEELGPAASAEAVFAAVKRRLAGSFSQTPQLEGPFGPEPLFGRRAGDEASTGGSGTLGGAPSGSPGGDGFCPVPAGDFGAKFGAGVGAPSSRLAVFERFLRVAERILEIEGGEPAAGAPQAPGRVGRGDETIVYVHGISRHESGYSEAWHRALAPWLAFPRSRAEVLWSQHVNPRSAGGDRAALAAERSALSDAIRDELAARAAAMASASGDGGRSPFVGERGDGLAIDDFTRYMLVAETREAILREFDQVVRPLLRAGRTIQIVSHSWGTVVAYEGLRRLDPVALPGRVATFFVVGSALSIGVVRANLFDRVRDGRRPKHVVRTINLDAGGDLVGGPIGPAIEVDEERLGLLPVGCARIPFTNKALNPACAHGSYFRADNVEVQKNIFARSMDEG